MEEEEEEVPVYARDEKREEAVMTRGDNRQAMQRGETNGVVASESPSSVKPRLRSQGEACNKHVFGTT